MDGEDCTNSQRGGHGGRRHWDADNAVTLTMRNLTSLRVIIRSGIIRKSISSLVHKYLVGVSTKTRVSPSPSEVICGHSK